jgi:hypothetical protein
VLNGNAPSRDSQILTVNGSVVHLPKNVFSNAPPASLANRM